MSNPKSKAEKKTTQKSRAKVIPIAPLVVSQDMLMSVVGIGRNTALDLEKIGKFPKRRKIPGTNRVGWYLGDLRLWAEQLPFLGEGTYGANAH